jgi:glycosyltransferase involved in cell wall biosynthesis
VHIRFLLMDAFSVGGTIRVAFTAASALADRHQVEVVSVYRRRPGPRLPLDPRVRLRVLSDERVPRLPTSEPDGRLERGLGRLPSVLVPWSERRHRSFSARTDLRLARYLRGLDGGVLVATRPGLAVATARWAPSGVVRVAQEHVFLANHPRALRRAIRRTYGRLDAVVTLTERDAVDYRALLGSTAGAGTRVACIPSGVPSTRARSTHGRKVVVAAGRLVPAKGFDRLVPAFAAVSARHPDWSLRIYGTGCERSLLEGLVHRHGLERSVQLMGYAGHLDEELAEASVFVLSSRNEGFPMVLLEAMSVGVPVVSFDCRNGPADLVTDGVDGLLVPQGDVVGLAEAMCRLIEAPGWRREMGQAALATAATYAPHRMAARWEELLSDLAGRPERPR